MNRNLLTTAGLLLLLAPAASALLDPIPPPEPLPDWTPTDATGYGIGTGTLSEEGCDSPYGLDIVLFDQTEARGTWSASFEFHNARTLASAGCTAIIGSPIILDGTFDRFTGGCFGGDSPPDSDELCLTFVNRDVWTGAYIYDAQDEHFNTGGPSDFYHGSVSVAFAAPLVPSLLPIDAEGVGAGTGSLVRDADGCTFGINIALFNETSARGVWSATFETHNPHTDAPVECLASATSPGPLDGAFDPATGGCFGGGEDNDSDRLCLTFASRDAVTGVTTYEAVDEDLMSPSWGFYRGSISIVFADPLVPGP